MNKEDEDFVKLQTSILNTIREIHYKNTTYQEFSDKDPVSIESILKIEKYFFKKLKNSHPDIDEFLMNIQPSLHKLNEYFLKNKFTARQVIKYLHTKYLSVMAYIYGGDLDGKIQWKKITEIIETTTIQ